MEDFQTDQNVNGSISIPNTGKWTLLQQIKEHVSPTARVMTDDYRSYIHLPEFGYQHDSVNHSRGTYALGDVHNNTVEGFWSILKRGVYGVYRVISKKYLQSYVDEYAYRYNHRGDKNMFNSLFKQVAEVKLLRLPIA